MSNLVVLLTNVLAVEKDNVKEQFNTDLLLLSKKKKKELHSFRKTKHKAFALSLIHI